MTQRRRSNSCLTRPLPLLMVVGIALGASAEAMARTCQIDPPSAEPVSARLSLYDLETGGDDLAIRRWTRGEPGGSVEHDLVSDGSEGRVLRVAFELDPTRQTRVGIGTDLGGLDARAYDHLELRVRGIPGGYPQAFEVGFLRPRPDRPGMMESGSHVVEGIDDRWRDVRVPLNLMTGLGDWTGLDEFVIAFDARRAGVSAGAIQIDDVALITTGRRGPSAFDPVPTPRKAYWERERGGRDASRAELVARLRGWPETLQLPPPDDPDDRAFLLDVARATWHSLADLVDRENGLPVDHVALGPGGPAPSDARIGDYTSPTNVGLWLMAVAGAEALALIERPEALQLVEHTLATLTGLERINGFFFNFYDTTTLERSSHFVSSVDASWLTAGLMVVRSAYPELEPSISQLIEMSDYGWLYDQAVGLMNHGYHANLGCSSAYHYGLLYTEARALSLIAIGKGDVPEDHWFRLQRTIAEDEAWQTQPPHGRGIRQVRGSALTGGWYERGPDRFVPSWGGSMFEALMPVLVIDEPAVAPDSLGANALRHAAHQRHHALEERGYPVWGMSPSATIGGRGYGEFGVPYLGVFGYPADLVTPHASALALAVMPDAAIRNLRELAARYPLFGEYGFYDAVDPISGEVALRYLTLDQAMLFLAIVNHLEDGIVQRHFAADPIAAPVLPMLAEERFFDDLAP